MEERQPFIQVENVSKVYQDGEISNKVLDNISFTIQEKELVAVVGDSGSGKTTLMNLLGALDKPSSGSIRIANKEISKMSQKERTLYRRDNIGFIFNADVVLNESKTIKNLNTENASIRLIGKDNTLLLNEDKEIEA